MELDTTKNLAQTRLKVKISRRDKSVETFAAEVLQGLSSNPKTLSPKYFYDTTGSKLFENICELPEYYLTRMERAILQKYSEEIISQTSKNATLVELGSGNSAKTRLLIEALLNRSKRLHYIPIDFAKNILVESAKSLLRKYSRLKITAVVSDYHTALKAVRDKSIAGRLILFLGSSIGNFDKSEAENFLKKTKAAMGKNDRLLIGIDLIKDKGILEAAYDDAQGVTAKFNLNLLVRINRELDGDFDLTKLRHKAFFNEKLSRIEMHIESTTQQTVTLRKLNRGFSFREGETIHTENSYKYSMEQIKELAAYSGFNLEKTWVDEKKWFSLNLLKPNQ